MRYIRKKVNTVKNIGNAADIGYELAPVIGGASLGYTIEHFKSNENKIEGRIGDFSDGIITQPIANLRKLMKINIELLK